MARFGDVGDTEHLSGFATADVSLALDLGHWIPAVQGTKLKVNIANITDNTTIINLARYTVGAGTPLYWTQPGRSVFATLKFKL